MAITIVATPGLATANSFANEAEFIAYAATLAVVPTSTTVSGSTCTEAEKKALVMAFRVFNNFAWKAGRTSSTQAGAWPQLYAENPDAPSVMSMTDLSDRYYDDGTAVAAGSFVVGDAYTIATVGTTDYTLIGASANTVGVQFTATGAGTGTGTAVLTASVPLRVKYGQIEFALAIIGGGTTDILAADPNAGVIEETVGPLTTRWSAYARAVGMGRYPQVFAYIGPMLAGTAGSLEIARS